MDDAYAELHCHSNFSFLDGASHPEELAEEATRLGLAALAITDHAGFYGVVRFAEAARAVDLPPVFGAELTLLTTGSARGGERRRSRSELAGAASARGSGIPSRSERDQKAGIPDPPGEHLIVLAQGPAGYARLAK